MKFARYLEETQTPEWKKAYIDYRGLKKRITTIRKAYESPKHTERLAHILHRRSSVATQHSPTTPRGFRGYGTVHRTPSSAVGRASNPTPPSRVNFSPPGRNQAKFSTSGVAPKVSVDELGADFELPPAMESVESLKGSAANDTVSIERRRAVPSRLFSEPLSTVTTSSSTVHETVNVELNPAVPPINEESPISPTTPTAEPRLRRLYSMSGIGGIRRRMTVTSRINEPTYSPWMPNNVDELLSGLGPNEVAFFTALDIEVDKVDKFYSEREQDARLKVAALKEQFKELRGHKTLSEQTQGLWPGFFHFLDSINFPSRLGASKGDSPNTSVKAGGTPQSNPAVHAGQSLVHDPDAYQRAKKRLKKAVLEFYRGLELLQNYRILNMTGFRKALKKFDKTTKLSTQNLYMRERIETQSFASGEVCEQLLKEIEKIYANRFERGNEKKARDRLRAAPRQVTHHFSTFRSGMMLGLSLPALAMGTFYVLSEEKREQIPEWAALLQVYAALCIPVVFSLLISLNMIAWARARINFIFIFELDARTVIDAREYIELPSFLFMTLSYAFWFSFSRAGAGSIAPTSWPLAWVVLAAVILANPLPLFHRSARYWLLATFGKLFISGQAHVEFKDFWMGDQLCSMVFTMGNLYFLVCAYTDHWHRIEERCQLEPHWIIPIVLTELPSLIRFVQCIRRYYDSRAFMHLVNAGKYTSSIIAYVTYYAWRHFGGEWDFRFVIWIIAATIGSLYNSYWDLTMDWSVLQVKGVKHKFLRRDLAYSDYIPVYYFAIISNVFIRFIWVWYIPSSALSSRTRGFIFALFEMLRRIQWNFFRLENEHIGNADQFRVTREVPLPYVFMGDNDSDDEETPKAPTTSRPVSIQLPTVGRRDLDRDVEQEGQTVA